VCVFKLKYRSLLSHCIYLQPKCVFAISSCASTHVAICERVFMFKYMCAPVCLCVCVCVCVPTGLIKYQIPFVLGAH